MKLFTKRTRRTITTLLLSITLLFGILESLPGLFPWQDGVCQPLDDEKDPPHTSPTTPKG